ncbi:hypothetical protein [Deinococcus radiophilus]|uniref:Uncharacterized protein n=1 Tax=Deinococcus radiophilus TaxID=32062 RepID=A0A3S0IJ88_9DEIO|nr:hypothetical protein [Deinococcus radiophilus]RTR25262.1 hypothetical protein EJ104_11700 [Deinococcus radiophilus]UFA50285.1 hypothetical protein LMT64_10500 [Deinococcus radiophilus]
MSRRRGSRPAAPRPAAAAREQVYRAGCQREWAIVSAEPDLAYTEQAFPECPTCPHRVEPEGAAPFCTLRPVDTPHPFAALAGLSLPDGD